MPLIEMQDWDGEMDVARGEAALAKLTVPVRRREGTLVLLSETPHLISR